MASVRPRTVGKVTPYWLNQIINLPSHPLRSGSVEAEERLAEEFSDMYRIFQFDQRPAYLNLKKDGNAVAWDVELPEDRFVVYGRVAEPRVVEGCLTLIIRRRYEHAMLLDYCAHNVYYVETVNQEVLDPFLQTLQHAKDIVMQLFGAVRYLDVMDNKVFTARRMQFSISQQQLMAAFVMLDEKEVLLLSAHKPRQRDVITENILGYFAEHPQELRLMTK